jgi:hypothetical protein
MRRALLVVLLVAGCGAAGLWLKQSGPALAREAPGRPKWEYAMHSHTGLMQHGRKKAVHESLNVLGEQGWELVSVVPGITTERKAEAIKETTYFFKRRKP